MVFVCRTLKDLLCCHQRPDTIDNIVRHYASCLAEFFLALQVAVYATDAPVKAKIKARQRQFRYAPAA